MKVINAENRVLGRLASEIARIAKDGESVRVVNSEKAVISGDTDKVIADYRQKYERGSKYRGPHFPKRPDKIVKRTVRGMLPDNGDFDVKAYLTVPHEFDEVQEVDVKSGHDLHNRNYVKLGDVSKAIGWTPSGDL
jgi:large subunit ribosomal protein L13